MKGTTTILRRTLAWAYALCAAGYLIYGLITATGLIGWLHYAQQRAFGSYSQKVSMLIAMLLVMVPAMLLRGRNAPMDPAGPLGMVRRANAPLTARGTLVLFGVLVVLVWSTGFGVRTWVIYQDQQDYGAHYAPLHLDGDSQPPGSVDHVALYGRPLERARLSFGRGRSPAREEYYLIPVVPKAWRPDQPVRYIVKSKTPSLIEPTYFVGPVAPDLSGRPAPEPAPLPVLARGGGHLSVPAAETFQHMGLTLVDEPILLERIDAINGKPIAPDAARTNLFFLVICSLCSVLLVIFYFAVLAGRRRRARSTVRALAAR
jgi:hypothetical protein